MIKKLKKVRKTDAFTGSAMSKRPAVNKRQVINKSPAIKGNFWRQLPKPFFVLAPMANVTDSAFRKMIAKYGKPDVTWTEFVSADGLISAGQNKLLHDLKFSKDERPVVAQLFTGKPEAMREAAVLIAKLGFDGLDINMGCPDRSVEKNGGGAAMMKNQKLAIEILKVAREGVLIAQNPKSKVQIIKQQGIPVSIKTRIGYNKLDLDWIKLLLEQKLPVLTVHLRTRKEMSEVPAHWDLMPEIVALRDQISPETSIIGNGDVESLEMAKDLVNKYGCDGIMVGRGIFGKPWFFEDLKNSRSNIRSRKTKVIIKKSITALSKNSKNLTVSNKIVDNKIKTSKFRLKVMLEHAKLFEKTFTGIKNFEVMKKHFKAYVSGWDGAKELRVRLMGVENYKDVKIIVDEYLNK